MSDPRNALLFGRYTREDCGLPPVANPALARWKTVLWAAGFLAALVVSGWLAGSMTARWRGARLAALPGEVAAAKSQREKNTVIARGRILATALRDDPEALLHLAEACLVAAQDAPRQIGYYANVASLLDGVGDRLSFAPYLAFRAESAYSIALGELGRDREALQSLNRADQALTKMPENALQRALRLSMVNHEAYILATSPIRQIRNPEKALHLAQIMVTSRDILVSGEFASASPAFVDTLASAWFAAGDAKKALEAQTLALGLAKPGDLAIYIKHYDRYASAGHSAAPGLMAQAWR